LRERTALEVVALRERTALEVVALRERTALEVVALRERTAPPRRVVGEAPRAYLLEMSREQDPAAEEPTPATSVEAIDRAVAEACAAMGLGGDDVFLVASLVERPRDTWPGCCGSGCQPCMDDVAAAALKARAILGWKGDGPPR
jgi:hypothetical protein